MPPEVIHLVLEIATPVVIGLLCYITLKIRSENADSKSEMMDRQNEVKEELVAKLAGIDRTIAVHIAEDKQQFHHMNISLSELKSAVNHIAKRGQS
jgi:hypothetical protein